MSILDIILIIILLMFAIMGWKQGLIKKAVSLVGIIVVFVIAFTCKEEIGNILCKYLPFFEFGGKLKDLVALNIFFYQLIGFVIIYTLVYAIYHMFVTVSGGIQKVVNATIILAIPSKLAGFVLGAIEGYIVLFAILLVVLVPFKEHKIVASSKLTPIIIEKTPIISAYTSNVTTTIKDIYDLVEQLTTGKLTTNEANIEMIDTMLKYDVISKKTIEQLIVLDKLNDIEGLDKTLEKYEK